MSGVGVNQNLPSASSSNIAPEVQSKVMANPEGLLDPNATYKVSDQEPTVVDKDGSLSVEVEETPQAAPSMPAQSHIAFHPVNSYQLLSQPELLSHGKNNVPTETLLRLAQKDNPGLVGESQSKSHNLAYYQKKMSQAATFGANHSSTSMATALRISSPTHPIVWFRSLSKPQQQVVLAKLQKDHKFAFVGAAAKIMMRQGLRLPPRLVTSGLVSATPLPTAPHHGPHSTLKTAYRVTEQTAAPSEAPAPTPERKRVMLSSTLSHRLAQRIGFSGPAPS